MIELVGLGLRHHSLPLRRLGVTAARIEGAAEGRRG
jgi:hypothetical protein